MKFKDFLKKVFNKNKDKIELVIISGPFEQGEANQIAEYINQIKKKNNVIVTPGSPKLQIDKVKI